MSDSVDGVSGLKGHGINMELFGDRCKFAIAKGTLDPALGMCIM